MSEQLAARLRVKKNKMCEKIAKYGKECRDVSNWDVSEFSCTVDIWIQTEMILFISLPEHGEFLKKNPASHGKNSSREGRQKISIWELS